LKEKAHLANGCLEMLRELTDIEVYVPVDIDTEKIVQFWAPEGEVSGDVFGISGPGRLSVLGEQNENLVE
jgi:hypothetical protein